MTKISGRRIRSRSLFESIRHLRVPTALRIIVFVIVVALTSGCGGEESSGQRATRLRNVVAGGSIAASVRTDPQSFNRYFANDVSTDVVCELTHARLVRINKVSWDVEPWLAESWTESADH